MTETTETVEEVELSVAELYAMFRRVRRARLRNGERVQVHQLLIEMVKEAERQGWQTLNVTVVEQALTRKPKGAAAGDGSAVEDLAAGTPQR